MKVKRLLWLAITDSNLMKWQVFAISEHILDDNGVPTGNPVGISMNKCIEKSILVDALANKYEVALDVVDLYKEVGLNVDTPEEFDSNGMCRFEIWPSIDDIVDEDGNVIVGLNNLINDDHNITTEIDGEEIKVEYCAIRAAIKMDVLRKQGSDAYINKIKASKVDDETKEMMISAVNSMKDFFSAWTKM